MDFLSAFKSEVFRPIATLFVPGSTTVAPYVLILLNYNPTINIFWEDHPIIFVTLIIMSALSVGMILENIGSHLESAVWDELIETTTHTHLSEWNKYLQLKFDIEPVGQRYLRTILLRMKFESSFGLSLFLCWLGLLWLNIKWQYWQPFPFSVASVFILFLSAFLIWESYGSAWTLADIRHLLVNEKPLGKARVQLSDTVNGFKKLLFFNALYSVILGVVLTVCPFINIFPWEFTQAAASSAPTRLLGVMLLGFGFLLLYIKTSSRLERVRTLAVLLFSIYLVNVVIIILPRGNLDLGFVALFNFIFYLIFLLFYGRFAFTRASFISPKERESNCGKESVANR